eukprot:TRINITY_DN28544_c0_g1_i1.p1 TRINITY_DN28544_c0_g1~~TRINITY_DN28544_c0_g1_i1.p1  ORF type:complete len:388 (+),score=74.67 TRINITY_DN28544_c0_g1_i1:47-1210(+)
MKAAMAFLVKRCRSVCDPLLTRSDKQSELPDAAPNAPSTSQNHGGPDPQQTVCSANASTPGLVQAAETAKDVARCFDLLDVIDSVGASCCHPWLLSRLSMASSSLRREISLPSFAKRRAAELAAQGMEWARRCSSLEQLAVGLLVARACSAESLNHLYFPYGGGVDVTPGTRHLLSTTARIGRRHSNVTVHVDAHVGAGAPSGIATHVSERRARSVLEELTTRGLQENKLSYRAWGRLVSTRWSEPEDDRAARAEVYFRMNGVEFPSRPDYYDLVPEAKRPVEGQDGAAASDSSDDEEQFRPFLRGTRSGNYVMISLASLLARHAQRNERPEASSESAGEENDNDDENDEEDDDDDDEDDEDNEDEDDDADGDTPPAPSAQGFGTLL